MSKQAAATRERLTLKQSEVAKALQQITERMANASERKLEVEKLQKVLGEEETKLNAWKEKVEEELRAIQPVLEAAKAAVGSIKKDNLNEIRAFRMPPQV